MSKKRMELVLVFLLALLPRAAAQKSDYPAPREPEPPKRIKSVEDVLPYARMVVKQPYRTMKFTLGIDGKQRGKNGPLRVLMISNTRMDPIIVEALKIAIRETGAKLDVIELDAVPAAALVPEPEEFIKMELKSVMNILPKWVWDAAAAADISIGGPMDAHLGPMDFERRHRTRVERFPWNGSVKVLEANLAALEFPKDLEELIDLKTWQILKDAREIHITDPLGTDLRVPLGPEYWKKLAEYDARGFFPTRDALGTNMELPLHGLGLEQPYWGRGHETVVPVLSPRLEEINGTIAASSLHFGLITPTRFVVERGQVTKVEGGGRAGEYFRELFQKYRSLRYPNYPGPGISWVEEISLGTHPKIHRPYGVKKGFEYAEGRKRSGHLHIAIGTSFLTDSDFEEKTRLSHIDLELFFPTYVVVTRDGRRVKLVDRGHLTVLDDAEVRKLAAKYGDPDQLLREDWVPPQPGVNVPLDFK